MLRIVFLILAISIVYSGSAGTKEVNYTENDSLIFVGFTKEFAQYKDLPANELLVKTASFFIGKPYVASTLEKAEGEVLTVNLREFDCMTLVETCLALTGLIRSGNLTFDNYCTILKSIRYRGGIIEDYASRLHYVSEWKIENEKNGLLTDLTKNLGGQPVSKTIGFMSAHSSSYPQIRKNKNIENKIKKNEARLNKSGGYSVLNKKKIPIIDSELKDGDIVAFSTTIEGLDFTHIGIIYTDEEQVTFIHASTNRKQIAIENKTLTDYCMASDKCEGIMILRLN